MNEQRTKAQGKPTWEDQCESFEVRVNHLKAITRDLANFTIVGGELDQLPSGYAASILFQIGGSVLCITAHSLTPETAQVLVSQDLTLWLRFQENENA